MYRLILTVLTLACLSGAALADGYVYTGRYYARAGQLYERSEVDRGCYAWYCGRWVWYPRTEYVYTAVQLDVDAPDFESKLLDVVKYKQKRKYNLALFQAAGLGEPYAPQSYAAAGAYAGQTQYGYSVSSLVDVYGSADINAAMQSAAGLAKDATVLTDRSHALFGERVRQLIDAQSQDAEARAKVALIEALARNSKPEQRARVETKVDGNVVAPQVLPQAVPMDRRVAVRQQALAGCVACHQQRDPPPAFDLSRWDSLTDDQVSEVHYRLTTRDVDKVMPRTGENKPGKRWGRAELSKLAD